MGHTVRGWGAGIPSHSMAAHSRGAAQPSSELLSLPHPPPTTTTPCPPHFPPLPRAPHGRDFLRCFAERGAASSKSRGAEEAEPYQLPQDRALSAPRLPGSAGGRGRFLHVAMAQSAQNSPENPTAVLEEQPAAGGQSDEMCAGNGCPPGGGIPPCMRDFPTATLPPSLPPSSASQELKPRGSSWGFSHGQSAEAGSSSSTGLGCSQLSLQLPILLQDKVLCHPLRTRDIY